MDHTKVYALEAFCATCPTVQEVTNLLQVLGFELAFNMGVDASPSMSSYHLCLPNSTSRTSMALKQSFLQVLM
jgi:hypothetical protein